MYAATGPEKDSFRGVVSQAPLIKLVDPPSKFVVSIASIICKIAPNFRIRNRVPVFVQVNGITLGKTHL